MAEKGHPTVMEEMLHAGLRTLNPVVTFTTAVSGHIKVVKHFVGLQGRCQYPQWSGYKALLKAAGKGNVDSHNCCWNVEAMLTLLVKKFSRLLQKAEILKCDSVRCSVIQCAALGGNPAIVKYILDCGGHVQFDSDAMLYQVVGGRGQMETAKSILDPSLLQRSYWTTESVTQTRNYLLLQGDITGILDLLLEQASQDRMCMGHLREGGWGI
ncbi:hypothetical protein M427DRAFT_45234 [Gonapodya prolifera JEL478]|uniref:Ankyrin n=1 Tax=Gonapodya prolifera (strain JEL478) TaxID=1344416 RepID=A0A139ACI7_GONPJ|nr:hypothetical protein M427DRAFT_45234 [Gonapodya prolifera JEL478]|eukprot:KXS14165.1 hypothetical protein M427DRAFT_45234 [Gonapodya prolifera JEL478]